MSVNSPPAGWAGLEIGIQLTLIARRLACATWRSRLGWPERTALASTRGDWSYARLYAAARAGAEQLEAAGARRGGRVAIALPAGPEFAQALHACLLVGASAVPVDLRLSQDERERVAAGAAVLV